MFLGSNIHVGNMSIFGGNTFGSLVSRAQVIGSDVALTNVSTGTRQSAASDGEVRAINLVSTDLTSVQWGKIAATVTEPSSYVYRIAWDGVSGTMAVNDTVATASLDRAAKCQARLISGSIPSSVNNFFSFRDGAGLPVGTKYLLENLTSEWQDIECSVTSATASAQVAFRSNNTVAATIEVRYVRATDTPSPVEAFPDGTGAGYVKVDSVSRGPVPMAFSMAGATNLVDTDLTNATAWVPAGVVPLAAVSEPSSNIYRLAFTSAGANVVSHSIASAAATRTARCQIRLISGSATSLSQLVFRNGPTKYGTPYTLDNLTSAWQTIDCKVTSADTTNSLTFFVNAGDVFTIEVRNMRAVDLSAPAAAFADGTGAAEVYAVDNLSCAPTYAAAGSLAMIVDPYGWATTGNPVAAQTRLFSATGMEVYLDASGFVRTTGGAVSTKKLAANTLSTVIVTWNGTNQTIKVDDETTVSAAAAAVPSGTTYWANLAAGTSPFHGGVAGLIDPFVYTEAQKEVIRTGLANLFSTVELV